MSRELLLARRLLDAVSDPYASPVDADGAAVELAVFSARFQRPEGSGYPVQVGEFAHVDAHDLNPGTWLLLLENAGERDSEVPDRVLDQLFDEIHDEVIRLRLVSGSVNHPRVRRDFSRVLESNPSPHAIDNLPDCWAKARLKRLEEHARTLDDSDMVSQGLRELVLYLLQDGSPASLALAAGAIGTPERWREAARLLASNVVRGVDPQLVGYGIAFRESGI